MTPEEWLSALGVGSLLFLEAERMTAADVAPAWLAKAGDDLPGWLAARTDGELIWLLLYAGVRQPTRERQNGARRLKRALDAEFRHRDGRD